MSEWTHTRPDWPKAEPTAAELIDYLLAWSLHLYAMSSAFAFETDAFERFRSDPEDPLHAAYMRASAQMIDHHNEYLLLRALHEVDPARADIEAARIWLAADAGDSYGEWLWEWASDAGMDPDQLMAEGKAAALAMAAKHPLASDRTALATDPEEGP